MKVEFLSKVIAQGATPNKRNESLILKLGGGRNPQKPARFILASSLTLEAPIEHWSLVEQICNVVLLEGEQCGTTEPTKAGCGMSHKLEVRVSLIGYAGKEPDKA